MVILILLWVRCRIQMAEILINYITAYGDKITVRTNTCRPGSFFTFFLQSFLCQALVCHSNFGIPRRTAAGTDFNRVNLLMAVLEKRLGLKLGDCDAYVNIAGGIKMNEPAIDLGIVLALISSYKDKPIDEKTICFGEVGLSGEVRAVNMAEQRVQEAKKLGFEVCILPEVCRKSMTEVKGIRLVGVSNLLDAMNYLK